MTFFVLVTFIEQVYSSSTKCYILWNVNLKYFFRYFGICLEYIYKRNRNVCEKLQQWRQQ